LSGDLDIFLQRWLPALLILLTGLAMAIVFWFLPKRKTGKYKPGQESWGRLRE
jgi:hypothetical protein